MATQDDTTPTPARVKTLATRQATLGSIALIGTFGLETAPRALIRLPGGDIARVTRGDAIAGGTVLAIDQSRLILSRMGRELVLELPQA